MLGAFFFWGWDTAANLNEESKNSTKTPGHAGVIAMFLLLLVFAMNIIAAQMLLPEKAWNAHQSTILLYFAQQAAGHWAGLRHAGGGAVLDGGDHPDHPAPGGPDHPLDVT